MTRFLLATRSEDKAREIRRILAPVGIQVHTLAEAGVPESADEDRIEAFETFRENARAKARYFLSLTGEVTLADDSGICVDALGGAPGVRSRRFSGQAALRGVALDRANNETLLDRLRGVPPAQRTARYVCAAAVAWPGGRIVVALGSVEGVILEVPAGSGGFGYDPLFFVKSLGRSFGEVDPVIKDEISHRARAFRALAAFLI